MTLKPIFNYTNELFTALTSGEKSVDRTYIDECKSLVEVDDQPLVG